MIITAKYEGETIRVKVTATDFDEVAITGNAATPPTGTVTLYDSVNAEVFTESLTWDDDEQYWFYDWDSQVGDAGTYKIRARFLGVDFDTWEYGRLQLKTNPVTIS